jgi:hypothetical protein
MSFVFNLAVFWCVLVFTYVCSRYALCLLLQILLIAALDIKMRDGPTVSSINSLLSQYCKASHFFVVANFYVRGEGTNCSLCPGWPMGKDRPWVYLLIPNVVTVCLKLYYYYYYYHHHHHLVTSNDFHYKMTMELSETLNLCKCVITHTRKKFDESYFAECFR